MRGGGGWEGRGVGVGGGDKWVEELGVVNQGTKIPHGMRDGQRRKNSAPPKEYVSFWFS